jgi:hypothetical protein
LIGSLESERRPDATFARSPLVGSEWLAVASKSVGWPVWAVGREIRKSFRDSRQVEASTGLSPGETSAVQDFEDRPMIV